VLLALTRAVPRSINLCELTHLAREPIDYARAVAEHDAYEDALRAMGCTVERLPEEPGMPDSVFVEDTAIVFDGLAVIARPGAASRRGEVPTTVAALTRYRRLAFIEAPATLDGGDVLVTPGKVFVGLGGRTNTDGVRQLAGHVAALGYDVIGVPVTECLHLKSAVSLLPSVPSCPSALLINRAWIDASSFAGYELIDVDPSEPSAANVLTIGDCVLCAAQHPRTRDRLVARGFTMQAVSAAELAKAEGGLTCGALLVTPGDS
jgi:dimethylargininase